ncbi:MAG: CPBP family intramembrane glutamic endopeptidase [Acidimicrobiia bacterium]
MLRSARSVRNRVVGEAGRCGDELAAIRAAGPSTSPIVAVVWSAATVVWGNGVVGAGRAFGHDQMITLIAVPLFGLAGWGWLARRGFRREAIGIRFPRVDRAGLLTVPTVVAAVVVALGTMAGLATSAHEMRGLRTIRTIVGTAFGEELIHRGVLLTLWASTGVRAWVVLAANMVGFGAWHVAGASCGGFRPADVLWPTIGAVLFVWLRLRFRSIWAPVAVHGLNVLGVFRPPKPPCPSPWG